LGTQRKRDALSSSPVQIGPRGRPHHVVKRAQDFDLDRLVALCPPCHAQTDAPYARGRLVITPLGAGRFTAEVTRGADKWAIRVAEGCRRGVLRVHHDTSRAAGELAVRSALLASYLFS
jgi:hypothetical protein